SRVVVAGGLRAGHSGLLRQKNERTQCCSRGGASMMDSESETKALILAAGLGTRLRPLTDSVPKCLIGIEGIPLLEYWIDALERAGIAQALVNTHHFSEQVREYLSQRNRVGDCYVHEAYEPQLLGSAGTVTANRCWADDASEMLIIYADNYSN